MSSTTRGARDARPDLTETLREYTHPATSGDRRFDLRQDLVVGYRPVAQGVARRYAGRGVPTEDLEQVATVGLIKAIDRYRPELGNGFLAYAVPYARGEIQRHFRDRGWSMRVPRHLKELHLELASGTEELGQRLGRAPRPSELAEHLGIPLGDVLDGLRVGEAYRGESLDQPVAVDGSGTETLGDQIGAADDNIELAESWHALRPLLDKLSERQRTILRLRFYEDHTQTQIGRRLGLSQMQISRLLAQILTELRTALLTDRPPRRPAGRPVCQAAS